MDLRMTKNPREKKTSHVCMLVHEVHDMKRGIKINQLSVLGRAEREVKNDISPSRRWWITKPASQCSRFTSGHNICELNRDRDTSRLSPARTCAFCSEAVSPVMQKENIESSGLQGHVHIELISCHFYFTI